MTKDCCNASLRDLQTLIVVFVDLAGVGASADPLIMGVELSHFVDITVSGYIHKLIMVSGYIRHGQWIHIIIMVNG